MQNATTRILTGHLIEYPLPDILGLLRLQRATGRLFIDYPAAPGLFFFRDGEPVEARVGALKGARALALAADLPDSPFNFDPQIEPPFKTVGGELREAVLELIGLPEGEPTRRAESKGEAPVEEGGTPRESAADVSLFARRVLPAGKASAFPAPTSGKSARAGRHKRILLFAGALLTLCVLAPIVALTDVFDGGADPAPAAAERAEPVATKGAAPNTHESLFGDSGFSVEAHDGGGRPAGVVEKREKVGQTTRAPSQKRGAEEVATRPVPAPPIATDGGGSEPPVVSRASNPGEPAVTVVTRVENGRVVEAYVANRRPGMEAYEASALRAARQRRFSPGTTGSEQIQIKVGRQ